MLQQPQQQNWTHFTSTFIEISYRTYPLRIVWFKVCLVSKQTYTFFKLIFKTIFVLPGRIKKKTNPKTKIDTQIYANIQQLLTKVKHLSVRNSKKKLQWKSN